MSESGFDLGLDDAAQAGLYETDADSLPALAAAARDAGLLVRHIDLDGCRDKATLLLRLSAVLDLPAGFGRNWDALSDALRDLDWLPAPGYALLLEEAGQLQAACPGDYDTLLDILHEASQAWAAMDVPFWVFLATDAEDQDEAGAPRLH
ncbi:barnase inhibitor [Pseudoxanthomonas broegbernensis]|uniref:Barnase inhibitor n=1 Tax=Pseudoxanthomonas broegbernensis TaxID=83619 RepID=A0A7V8GJZ5_9GAMM|nr:barstar family protein [Pseudoxanthomonas broegbernensis]KAF1684731.1 barnase inhibitor [Pseudoxanthomonas broegbernensis]MBB6066401.1 RNAse (barnase) inhibitor barstar [Pseudoxanthomonas broegbernensis]